MMSDDASNCGGSEPFALRVIGNDMSPEFEDGHIIIVDPGGLASSGSYVVARTGDEIILRQLQIQDREYRLSALNSGTSSAILKNGLNDIVGVVSQRTGVRRKEHKRYDLSYKNTR